MLNVIIALLPVIGAALYKFGIRVLFMVLVGLFSAVAFEHLFKILKKEKSTISDLSAVVTGLLVALSYPVTAPYWILILGSFIAIVLIKQVSGGLGRNQLNPAVFSRVIIKILFTPIMTNWVLPGPDLQSTATPLTLIGNGQNAVTPALSPLTDLFLGHMGGGIGEVVKWAILLGYLYLVITKTINWEVPVASIAGLFLMGMLFGKSNLTYATYHILAGTALFASVFMVTDYSSTPLNRKARFYFALGVGLLTGIIRYAFDFPGGIGIAILIMNVLSPFLDAWLTTPVFGEKRRRITYHSR